MEENKHHYDRLIRLADLMEQNCDDPQVHERAKQRIQGYF